MPLPVGSVSTVAIREVWPTEHADFTPWLQAHIGELDKVLGLGLSNPQREVGAGDFSIDQVESGNGRGTTAGRLLVADSGSGRQVAVLRFGQPSINRKRRRI